VLSCDEVNYGYNAAKDCYKDLMAAGIMDPSKAFIIASTATEEEMLHWYHEHIVWADKTLNMKLLRKGILTRIYAPMFHHCLHPAWMSSKWINREPRVVASSSKHHVPLLLFHVWTVVLYILRNSLMLGLMGLSRSLPKRWCTLRFRVTC
ncbi:hypothetical protein IFM89_023262, partial [Coptis chinensis]